MKNRIRYTLKTPLHKGRTSFSIVKDQIVNGERSQPILVDERIDSINKDYKEGKPLEQCLQLAREVQQSLYDSLKAKESKVVHNSANRMLVEKYFQERYTSKRIKQSSKKSMRYDLLRAVDSLGPLSLYTATEDQIQRCADALSNKEQRRVIFRLRQLLGYINRNEINLCLAREEKEQVPYLEMEQVEQLIEYFSEDRIMACLIGIGTKCGLRLGEIYALEKSCIRKDGVLFIQRQKYPDGSYGLPKYGKKRNAFVVEDGMEYVKEWLSIPQDLKDSYRSGNNRIPTTIGKATEFLFTDPINHLNFHDTRHCYAIHILSKGASVDHIALSMGNSPAVCRNNYLGFILSDSSIEALKSLFPQR